MYNTISSFDASLARDPTNTVEIKKQDGRMVGPLKSSCSFSFKLNYCSILLPLRNNSLTIAFAGLYLLGACRDVSAWIFTTSVKSVIISKKLECK